MSVSKTLQFTAALGLVGLMGAVQGATGTPLTLASLPAATPEAGDLPRAWAPPACGMVDFQKQLLERLNAVRARGAQCGRTPFAAAPALRWNRLLQDAAGLHAADMARHDRLSHIGSDGRTVVQRTLAVGYDYGALAENVAAGQRSVDSAVDDWMRSAGHCENIMNPALRDVAVACVRDDATTHGWYWSMSLGRTL